MVNILRRVVRIVRNVIQSPIIGRKRFGAGKTLIGLLITIAILLPKGDTLMLRQSEWVAAGYRFDLMGWELANFPAKCTAGSDFDWQYFCSSDEKTLSINLDW